MRRLSHGVNVKSLIYILLAMMVSTATLMPKAMACTEQELDQSLTQADEGFHPPNDEPGLARQATQLLLKLRECDQQGVIYSDAGENTHGIILGIETKLDCKLTQVQHLPSSKYCAGLGY